MCNNYRLNASLDRLREAFSQLNVPLRFEGEAAPNFPPKEDIRISDKAPIIRRDGDGAELSFTPWAWKGPTGAAVFNFRSDGRDFSNSERCLIPADGFYEFTARDDGKKSPKHKHLFTVEGADLFWIAGIVKQGAFAMLTTEPGPDVAPYHSRQIVVLPIASGMDWLDLTRSQSELLRALPAQSLRHEQLT